MPVRKINARCQFVIDDLKDQAGTRPFIIYSGEECVTFGELIKRKFIPLLNCDTYDNLMLYYNGCNLEWEATPRGAGLMNYDLITIFPISYLQSLTVAKSTSEILEPPRTEAELERATFSFGLNTVMHDPVDILHVCSDFDNNSNVFDFGLDGVANTILQQTKKKIKVPSQTYPDFTDLKTMKDKNSDILKDVYNIVGKYIHSSNGSEVPSKKEITARFHLGYEICNHVSVFATDYMEKCSGKRWSSTESLLRNIKPWILMVGPLRNFEDLIDANTSCPTISMNLLAGVHTTKEDIIATYNFVTGLKFEELLDVDSMDFGAVCTRSDEHHHQLDCLHTFFKFQQNIDVEPRYHLPVKKINKEIESDSNQIDAFEESGEKGDLSISNTKKKKKRKKKDKKKAISGDNEDSVEIDAPVSHGITFGGSGSADVLEQDYSENAVNEESFVAVSHDLSGVSEESLPGFSIQSLHRDSNESLPTVSGSITFGSASVILNRVTKENSQKSSPKGSAGITFGIPESEIRNVINGSSVVSDKNLSQTKNSLPTASEGITFGGADDVKIEDLIRISHGISDGNSPEFLEGSRNQRDNQENSRSNINRGSNTCRKKKTNRYVVEVEEIPNVEDNDVTPYETVQKRRNYRDRKSQETHANQVSSNSNHSDDTVKVDDRSSIRENNIHFGGARPKTKISHPNIVQENKDTPSLNNQTQPIVQTKYAALSLEEIQVLESRALARLEAARTDLKANDEGAHTFSRTMAAKITSLHTDISKLEDQQHCNDKKKAALEDEIKTLEHKIAELRLSSSNIEKENDELEIEIEKQHHRRRILEQEIDDGMLEKTTMKLRYESTIEKLEQDLYLMKSEKINKINQQDETDSSIKQEMTEDISDRSTSVDNTFLDFLASQISAKESDLECPVCLEISEAPIYTCLEQHIICSKCWIKMKNSRMSDCVICRSPYPEPPRHHRYMEKVSKELDLLYAKYKQLSQQAQ